MDTIDLKTERYIINRFVSMPKLFDSLGIDYRINANMFCPFHLNENTPAAHLYADEDGYRLWCFSESKMYGAWNVYKTFLPKIDTNKLALLIFNKLPEDVQEKVLSELDIEQDVSSLPYQKELQDFKRHKIDITQLLQIISNSFTNN